MITSIQPILNSGSKSMNVNGSGTPKTFSYSPASAALITGFICLLKHDGNTAFNKFGALSALTNGVLMQATLGGTTSTIATVKDNADLCTTFHYNQFGNGAILSILSLATAEGFGASNNIFVGFLEFHNPITLASGDSVSVVIQDNLSTVDFFQMSCKVVTD